MSAIEFGRPAGAFACVVAQNDLPDGTHFDTVDRMWHYLCPAFWRGDRERQSRMIQLGLATLRGSRYETLVVLGDRTTFTWSWPTIQQALRGHDALVALHGAGGAAKLKELIDLLEATDQ